ncbi:P-loop containing nucleoside triphosphate hydrolase protein [Fimicolochytrium jonesii]|uniref:P-loop containing nucleoside triphosphate hydrolase protein n=1 Tax=Fimicolochytrium jonesii TaxID=1396493 RepID=UPI0022FDE797|nr:P-loop containing nucleoside triphosphate hydrolase protein [Fimicolochytrium jonesii]KAI8823499.1 P-loop containing nucleoside triphosphate hydrolase protein [Fimicolochytrium jonesii]
MEQKRARHAAKFELSTESELDQSERRSMAHMKRLLNFDSLGLRADVAETATSKLGYKRPTTVQALCIPEILNNDQDGPILCAAETGGGKTGAYLLPIIHTLKQQEEDAVRAVAESESALDIVEAMTTDGQAFSATAGLSQIRKLRRPRAVIVVPSRELVMQVTETAKTMCHSVRLRVVGAHAGITKSDMEAKIVNAPVDLLVATPGSLNFLLTKEGFAFSQTRLLVIDEADTMTDEDFGPDLERILRLSEEQRTKQHQRCQTVFVSATVPVSLIRTLERHFPTYRRIATPSVHRTVPGLTQRFVRIENGTVKQTMLLDILKRAVLMDDRIIIFCNTRKSCEAVTNLLRSKEYDVQDISSNVHVSFRAKALKRFAAAVDPLASLKEVENVERQTINRVPIILVATDIASRGLDTVNVGHVILYDFPQTAIDYLHRVGRTARNGRSGRATSIVAKKDMALADSIESSIRGRMSLA